ncbi:hypothetical protein FUA48_08645 [Flavobacterium alkalisoli]|uniref:Uncharacterized protein n=1 Tax=Flavobacterium alkalisoli TaxID=2602769 RepID=A0A5B9FTU6_9FLAO|nr:hypothetical protein [Flavobacterium alkalisoli]QEE49649.1 hypothetical protein FUA48_08645 [Flavobacterium alkalisoli]
MKLKKPSAKKVTDTAALTGGVIVGGAVSKGVFGLIHSPAATEDTAEQKKQENAALVKRALLIAATGAGAVFLEGNDSITSAAKGTLIGMAAIQTLEAIATLAKRSGVTPEAAATTAPKKFLARVAGLGCPCTDTMGMGSVIPMALSPRYNLDMSAERGLGNSALDLFALPDPLAVSPAI